MTWAPSDISGLVCTIDPSASRAANLLWQDAAKTTQATADGHRVYVAQCPVTGVEFHCDNNGQRPTLKQVGGKWLLRGDGSNLMYASVATSIPCAAAMRLLLTGYAGTGYRPFIEGCSAGPTAQYGSNVFDGTLGVYGGPSTGTGGGTINDALAHNLVLNWSTSANGAKSRIDGSQVMQTANGAASATILAVFTDFTAVISACDIYRMAFCSGDFNSTDRTNLEGWWLEDGTPPSGPSIPVLMNQYRQRWA